MNYSSSPDTAKVLLSVLLGSIGLFLLLAIMSYSPFDPGWTYISSDTQQVSNLGGVVGAWFADVLRAMLGWASFLVPFYLAYEVWQVWKPRAVLPRVWRYFAQTFLLVMFASLLALVRQQQSLNYAGGVIGYEVGTALAQTLTIYGAIFVILLMFVLACNLVFVIHWQQLGRNTQIAIEFMKDTLYRSQEKKGLEHLNNAEQTTQTTESTQDDNQANSVSEIHQQIQNTLAKRHTESTDETPVATTTHLEEPIQPAQMSALHHVNEDVGHRADTAQSHLYEIQQLLAQSKEHRALSSTTTRTKTEPTPTYSTSASPAPSVATVSSTYTSKTTAKAWQDDQSLNDILNDLEQQIRVSEQVIHQNDERINDLNRQLEALEQTKTTPKVETKPQQSTSTAQQTRSIPPSPIEPETTVNHVEKEKPLIIEPVRSAPTNTTSSETSHVPSTATAPSANALDQALARRQEQTQAEQPQTIEEKPISQPVQAPVTTPSFLIDEEEHQRKHESLQERLRHPNPLDDLEFMLQQANQRKTSPAPTEDVAPVSAHHHTTPVDTVEQPNLMPTVAEQSLSDKIKQQVAQMQSSLPLDDDWDAPLTDASGRVVSRAMQVAEKRKHLSPLPSIELLDKVDPNKKVNFSEEQLNYLSQLLELKLQDFNIKAQVKEIQPGPVVTRFALELAPGVKASKVTGISQDLARSMSMASIRVVQVIPGKPYIGIEIPNSTREMVRLIELVDIPAFKDPNALLNMAMGKDIAGNPVLADLAKAPHMLVAGTTGSGKSVAVNSMLLSMLLKYTPEQLRLLLIDPKQLELANYDEIPHLLTPVVTDMKDATNALNWCVKEMERRYNLMSLFKVRKINDFNQKIIDAQARGEDLIDPLWKPDSSAVMERAPRLQPLPMIVIVADEFADMIMQVGKKAEEMITRLAQKSRAAGIHLLLATQRPSVDVITGLIKANVPTRVALRVNSKIDSRTILDAGGAEDLLGHGDMLFLAPGKNEPERLHGAFISDDEVNRICDAWRERGSPNYVAEILDDDEEDSKANSFEGNDNPEQDVLYDKAVEFVLQTRKASASALQRQFNIGFNRAANLMEDMERNGIVSPSHGSNRRDILV